MSLKLIIRGRLEYGSQRSFETAQKHFITRTETVYRADVLFKAEQILDAEAFALVVPPNFVVMSTEKHWRTTTELLREMAQFAVSGAIKCWAMSEGSPIEHLQIEPSNDKGAVVRYRLGCDLMEQEGKEEEAKQAFDSAIERYENHALAYERRGRLNYNLRNFNDARYDFEKAIKIYPAHPEAWFGLGKVKMIKQDWAGALAAFSEAMKHCIALQPIFWQARRSKGECQFKLKMFKEAAEEFAFLLDRKFKDDDPNRGWRRKVAFLYGRCLFEMGEAARSVSLFTDSMNIEEGREFTPDAEMLYWRALAQKQLGKKDFIKDLKASAEQGYEDAVKMLAELS